MDIWIYFIAVILVLFAYLFIKLFTYIHDARRLQSTLTKLIPGEPYHWLYGHMNMVPSEVNAKFLATFDEWVKKYPRYFLFRMGPLRTKVILNHPETIKQLTNTAEGKQVSWGGAYNFFKPWVGDGLLLSDGAKWHRNRKMLTYGFHFDVLKHYVDIYNDCTDTLLDIIGEESVVKSSSVDIFERINRCALDIVLRCAFSTSKNVQRTKDDAYLTLVREITDESINRTMNPLLYSDFIYCKTQAGKRFLKNCHFSHQIAYDVMDKRKDELASPDAASKAEVKRGYMDFLDILLLAKDSDGNGLNREEIRDEVETFMFAGHDTTTSGISFILHNLARHPDIQSKARDEVDALLEGRESDRILYKDLSGMPYLTQCIKESLRLDPPVPWIGRELSKPLVIDGMQIPAGALVDVQIWNLHHNPSVWKDPFAYDPDRFTLENIKEMDSHAFLPFSAGPRNCIGQNFAMNEMKTTVARILRKFIITADESIDVKRKMDSVLRAENGINLQFKDRK